MARFNCFFSTLLGKKRRSKVPSPNPDPEPAKNPDQPDPPPAADAPTGPVLPADYDGGDEHDETLSMKRDTSELDLQALADKQLVEEDEYDAFAVAGTATATVTPDFFPPQSGHVSDPGTGPTAALWGSSPALKRSCSNIETKRSAKARSFPFPSEEAAAAEAKRSGSPVSVRSDFSADRVMLKKRSSSQVLPSRSRKLWWRLFLWSHRNLHGPLPPIPSSSAAPNRRAGYSSDTLEQPAQDKRKNKKKVEESGKQQYQWVAFSAESSSPLGRVGAWVDSLEESRFFPVDDDEEEERGGFVFPEVGESSGKSNAIRRLPEEVVQANNVIQSLNSFSSVAHISGMGLKVVPSISAFTGLRSVNLSGNFIVQINSGSLPRSLHTLDLSRNKIGAVEGLRELTRLRVLNLSYNRISRIGHGLSNCTLIKELYLAGNKISDVEGLHRLLKLTVLDLSFNKIATAKALGQLVANYNSLLALNLIGNPVQTNIGDDHLRKAVSSLLPHLTYINKQPIKPQRARDAATDSIAKAALSSGGTGTRRRTARRASQASGMGSSSSGHQYSSWHKTKGRHQHSTTSSRK
ncbi:Uncharacterized protein M6B38_217550 [Iris pallida]|uniref:Uncharacterized protein n=1 Tax=Iris pallida TaxID=29817 RepID=A0AAX6E0K7_IRIPA|nr:Uncharacterized protein M6B38_217550 [Iris pallida]